MNQLGFSLVEILISLLILSLILLGFDCMQIYALRENRNAYYFSVAENQLISFTNRLRVRNSRDELTDQVTRWNEQNHTLLPYGKGYVTGVFPFYTTTLFWGDKTNKRICKDLPIGQLKCLSVTAQVGFTLIELMLGMTIALLILSIITTIYLSAEKNFRMQAALSTIQENARTAFELLRNDISLAGYIGCAKLTDDFPVKNLHQYNISKQNKILISQKKSILVRHVSLAHADLIKMNENSVLYTTANISFSENEILLIADCKTAEIFQVKKISFSQGQQIITPIEPLANRYEKNAEVGKFQINKYFIANTDRQVDPPLFSLYLTDIKNHTVELVESVDEMTITDMFDQNGVEVSLTLSSPDHFLNMKKTWSSFIAFRE